MAETLTLSAFRSAYSWDSRSQRYRLRRGGHYVARQEVKRMLLSVVDGTKADLRRLAARMAEGAIEISRWQRETAATLKSLHLASWAAARGGFHSLTASDYGRVGAVLAYQYRRLASFALDVEQGRMTGPQIEQRSTLYAASANGTFEGGRRYGAMLAQFTEERRVLGNSEHCPGCVEQAMLKWQPIGSLLPVGEGTPCRMQCRCSFIFR